MARSPSFRTILSMTANSASPPFLPTRHDRGAKSGGGGGVGRPQFVGLCGGVSPEGFRYLCAAGGDVRVRVCVRMFSCVWQFTGLCGGVCSEGFRYLCPVGGV